MSVSIIIVIWGPKFLFILDLCSTAKIMHQIQLTG